ncbi:MAG: glycosyltransferase family 39 protein [Minisyncoccales bacterium]
MGLNEKLLSFLKNPPFLAILCFLAIALFLNFIYLPLPSLWVDEAWLVNLAKEPLILILNKLLIFDAHLPLYYLIIKFVRLFFGGTEGVLRFPALFFGLAVVPGAYFLGKEIFSKKAGLWAAALAATNYFIIWFSHQIRMYTLAAFLSALSSYFLIRLLKDFNRKNFLGYVILSILGVYNHYWFILVLFSHFVFLVLSLRRIQKVYRYFFAHFVIFLFFLPWLIAYLSKTNIWGANAWIKRATLGYLLESFDYFTYGQLWIFLIFGAMGVGYLVLKWKKEKLGKEEIFYLVLANCLFWVPLFSGWIISQFFPIYTPGRREIVVLPAFFVLVAYPLSYIPSKAIQFIALILFIVSSLFKILNVNQATRAYQFDDKIAAAAILKKITKEDVVIFTELSRPTFEYYFDLEEEKSGFKPKIVSFPLYMEINPTRGDWLDKLEADELKSKEEVQKVLDALGENGKVFLVYAERPLNKMLADELTKRMKIIDIIGPPSLLTSRMPSWFHYIIVFERK